MGINKVPYPTTPVPVSDDWGRMINIVQSNNLNMEIPRKIDYETDDVLKGAVFQIGGAVYLADADTAITGTPSDYVKITPGVTTAAAAYVANLTGVTWNSTYNGYYDVSGNLYIFNEGKALSAGDITEIKGRFIQQDQSGGISLDVDTEYGTNRPLPARAAFRSLAYNYSSLQGPTDETWVSMCWAPALSLFCAVSNSGKIATSPEGTIWSVLAGIQVNTWESICWSSDLTLFCAVSADGSNRVVTSPDGVTWTARNAAEANTWEDVTWSSDLTLFCAVASTGTNRVMTSPDGVTWTARNTSSTAALKCISWSPELGIFVSGSSSSSSKVLSSTDGINWSENSEPAGAPYDCDGVKWASSLGKFCMVTSNNKPILSSDGTTWTLANTEIDAFVNIIEWSEELEIFVTAGAIDLSNSAVYTSIDGFDWTKRPIDSGTWNAIAWANELGIFCIISSSGAPNTCQQSRRFI